AVGPLGQMRARRTPVRFCGRDELDILLDWCRAPDTDGPRTRIAIVHGSGGSGKTRLAAELCERLTRQGWYAGFLPKDPSTEHLDWLGTVVSPLLAVVDYAEAAQAADARRLLSAITDRTTPTCVVLTARAISGWWANDLEPYLRNSSEPLLLKLPDRH